jgi:hypothetical protein
VINHLHCIEPGVMVVGYLNASSSYDPSLTLMKLDSRSAQTPLALCKDMRDAVCMCEQFDAPHHRYYTHFIEQW